MRKVVIVAISLFVLVIIIGGIIGSLETNTPTPTPTPTPALMPGEGTAGGRVLYEDGTPVYGQTVYIFKEGETRSFASSYLGKGDDGYYKFWNLPVGRYEVYLDEPGKFVITGWPSAEISVREYQNTVVRIITLPIAFKPDLPDIDPKIEFITNTQPAFSWEAIPGAEYYEVLVLLLLSEDSNQHYDKKIDVSDTQVTWSELIPGYYMVSMLACDEQGNWIRRGTDFFDIPTPAGS